MSQLLDLQTAVVTDETLDKVGQAEALRLLALRDGVSLSTDSLKFPILGKVIPRFEIDLEAAPIKRITVRVNQLSPLDFDGTRLAVSPRSSKDPLAIGARTTDDDPDGVYKFGMMRENAQRSWVYDYHTFCSYSCSFCFKESEWEIRALSGNNSRNYKANFEECIEHAQANAKQMSAEYDIVWLCTGSITNDRLELERHCRLASALRDNGFTGGIYLSQVISKVMRKDDDVCRHHLSALKEAGVTRFNTGVEIADTDLRKRMIAGHKGDLVFDDYLRVFRMATEIFGSGNAGTCLLAGIEPAEVTLSGLRELVEIGVAPAPTVFTPFTVDQMRIPFVLTLAELAELSAAFRQLQIDHGLPLFSGVFSLT